MTSRRRACALATLMAFANAACVEAIPPPPPPSENQVPLGTKLLPQVAGRGRVVIDATNGPAHVDEIVGREEHVHYGRHGAFYSEGEIARPICASTPCAANLDYGQHLLRFRSLDDDYVFGRGTVAVDANDAAFLHTMGGYYPGGGLHTTGATLGGLGFLTGLVGGSLIVAGAIRNAGPDNTDPGRGLITGGEVTLGIGIGLIVLGIVLTQIDHPTVQDGTSRQFPIAAPPPSPVAPAPPTPPLVQPTPAATAPSGSSL